MCAFLFWLTWCIIAASVDDLPEPVTPVTRTRPRSSMAIVSSTDGSRSSVSVGILALITRSTTLNVSRWRKMLTRKRPSPGME